MLAKRERRGRKKGGGEKGKRKKIAADITGIRL